MKKIITAAFAVAFAAVANAGTVTWGSGLINTAADINGGWSTTTTAMAASQLVTMSIYLVDATEYSTVSALDQKGIYDWTSGKTADYSGTNFNGTKYIGAITVKDTTAAANTAFNSIIVATYTDTTLAKDFYIATAATGTTTATGNYTFSNAISSLSTSGGWQAVPEPTSGLLLLLGMAGLALKRKQA